MLHSGKTPKHGAPARSTRNHQKPFSCPRARNINNVPRPVVAVRNSDNQEPESAENIDELKRKFFNAETAAARTAADDASFQLDSVNPIALGKQARKAFDEVWSQLSNLASPTKSFVFDDTMEPGRDAEFEAPQAAYTTVLVVGATGRVGRVLIRKLLLRGYKVKALVRRREQGSEDVLPVLPAAVEIVEGDVGDIASCQLAVRGVDKVIFCAGARSTMTPELLRVDDRGVANLVKALQDENARSAHRARAQQYAGDNSPEAIKARRKLFSSKSKKEIADFAQTYHQLRWDITFVGTPEERAALEAARAASATATEDAEGQDVQRPAVERWVAASKAVAEINEEDHLVFEGTMYQRGAYAEVGAQVHHRLPGGEHRWENTEGITMRIRGDGQQYACVLTTVDGTNYIARFPTRAGYLNVRLPYTAFRAEQPGQPALVPKNIRAVAMRYEAKRALSANLSGSGRVQKGRGAAPTEQAVGDNGKFSMEIDWIKALPSGEEPDVILVSMSRNALISAGLPEIEAVKVLQAKRKGEEFLRLSGLGYTVIRAGRIVEEPGGYKSLIFDQGDRIDQPISAADVADICLRSLHESAARNKTFDVCYEVSDTGSSMYELVTSAPDKSVNYLTQATSALSKNT